jgi:hypothetical protein
MPCHGCFVLNRRAPLIKVISRVLGDWIEFPAETMIFLFSMTSTPDEGHTQSLIREVSACFGPGIKQMEHESEHLVRFSVKVKKAYSFARYLPYTNLRGATQAEENFL